MTGPRPLDAGRGADGTLPPNVRVGLDSVIVGDAVFKRFRSRRDPALTVGTHCTLEGVQFALGEEGVVTIGDYCCLTNAIVLAECAISIGSYVVIGWNATLADSDFHPTAPAERIADALACSPLGGGRPRPPILRAPIVVEDDVWIGPGATILKGVRIGAGAFVEAGAVVTHDVRPGVRMLGNPARETGTR